jgi:hypothetical protein
MGYGLVNRIYWLLIHAWLVTTLYRSLIHKDYCFQSITVSISCFLATASIQGDSSASHTQVLLSQATCAEFLSAGNSTNWVPSWWPFHTNLLVFSSQADFQLLNSLTNRLLHVTSLNWTAGNCHSGPHRKYRFHCYCPTIPRPLHKDRCLFAYCIATAVVYSHRLAMGLYATIT